MPLVVPSLLVTMHSAEASWMVPSDSTIHFWLASPRRSQTWILLPLAVADAAADLALGRGGPDGRGAGRAGTLAHSQALSKQRGGLDQRHK